jgi:hypothetical protein
MPQGWSRNDRDLPSPPLVSVTGAPPLPTKDRRQPSCDTHHPPSILRILAASLWNVNRNPTKGVARRRRPSRRVCISWSPFVWGFDTGCRPPTTSTNGIRGLPRTCTRNGGINSMARSHVDVGEGGWPSSSANTPNPNGTIFIPITIVISTCRAQRSCRPGTLWA